MCNDNALLRPFDALFPFMFLFSSYELSMTEFFDTHCHLNPRYLKEDVEDVIERATAAGVRRMTVIGCGPSLEETREAVAIAERFENVWATVGLHPHESSAWSPAMRDGLEELSKHPKVVAIGECGLDFHYDNSPREAQRAAFKAQLALADAVDMPVVIHNRSSDEDCIEILKAHYKDKRARGVIHCFSSSQALATCALELGFHLGFTGIITFNNAENVRDVLRSTPMNRVVIETDAPFLAPMPYRGKTNEPAYVRHVAEKIAEVRDMTLEAVAEQTTRNARTLYGV